MVENENELRVVQRYLDLTETVDEAFKYIKNKPLIEQVSAVELMYPDILKGLEKMSETHQDLIKYFHEDEQILKNLGEFNALIENWELDMPAPSQSEKLTRLLIKELGPHYEAWKTKMAGHLQKTVLQ